MCSSSSLRLFDFRDMGNISPACAYQHIEQTVALDVAENCTQVIDGMFDDNIFHWPGATQTFDGLEHMNSVAVALAIEKPVPSG